MLAPSIVALNILTYTLTLFILVFCIIAAVLLGLRLWIEPIKGVCKSKANLRGKVVLITGGNSGIGLETARDLAKREARVIIASRDVNKSAAAVEDIIKTTGNKNVEYLQLDLSKFENVRKFAEYFNNNYDRLDVLVNNSGCAGIKNRPTEDGIDIIMQVNYFGPFLLTSLLLDKLIASRPSRIVNVSSCLHSYGNVTEDTVDGLTNQTFWRSYCNSKLCLILWTKALAKRLPHGVTINALHPGIAYMEINNWASIYKGILKFFMGMFFKNTVECAQTTIDLCANEDLEDFNGAYFQDCKRLEPCPLAIDYVLIEKIWNKSLLLTKACYGSICSN